MDRHYGECPDTEYCYPVLNGVLLNVAALSVNMPTVFILNFIILSSYGVILNIILLIGGLCHFAKFRYA
jgi:hypothetical protein